MVEVEAILRDVTERRRVEEALRKQERRLASVETLRQTLATLSHYINNATTSIAGYAQLCDRGDTTAYQRLVKVSLSQTERISAVLRALNRMVKEMDIRTTDYVGFQDAMFDLEEDLRRTLEET